MKTIILLVVCFVLGGCAFAGFSMEIGEACFSNNVCDAQLENIYETAENVK